MDQPLLPAAQYLRMSTDHQQYSLENQTDAIARYSSEHGFQIVKTYSDPARSGMLLKNRAGLKQLLKDVMDGQLEFRAVLVYDESRWGRFQDTDEAAHYEYLCKSSGIPVHYWAEPFLNDNSTFANIVKALKRSMAAEYSRELSTKVRAGMVRLATRGYSLGGMPGYGWRRQLLDAQGSPKQLLMEGERKSIATERIVLVPGPREEVAVVARIFHELVDDHRSFKAIAKRLNQDGIAFVNGAQWARHSVASILQTRGIWVHRFGGAEQDFCRVHKNSFLRIGG